MGLTLAISSILLLLVLYPKYALTVFLAFAVFVVISSIPTILEALGRMLGLIKGEDVQTCSCCGSRWCPSDQHTICDY